MTVSRCIRRAFFRSRYILESSFPSSLRSLQRCKHSLKNFILPRPLKAVIISMSVTKILVVFGVTGNQGGSVVYTILKDPGLSEQFEVRGITRDPTKPSATALAERGVVLFKVSQFCALCSGDRY